MADEDQRRHREAQDRNARAQLAMEERAHRARQQKAAREAELTGAVMWEATCYDTTWGEHRRHVYAKTTDQARRKLESFDFEIRSEIVRVGGGHGG